MGNKVEDKREKYHGTGRRKCAVARVMLLPGEKNFLVNGKSLADYIDCPTWQKEAMSPLVLVEGTEKYGVRVRCSGGGKRGQAGAILLGISRALCKADPELQPKLRKAGFLTRDSRMVERKKPGLRGARRRPQFSKR